MLHKLIDISGHTLRPILGPLRHKAMSQVPWVDAIFVRDYTNLSTFSDVPFLKASVILNDVYLTCDIVVHLLAEYDRRRAAGQKRNSTVFWNPTKNSASCT